MRVFVDAYGCAQNHGEASALARQLEAAGHHLADGPVGAEAGVLVTCGVIGATEARMVRRWRHLSATVPRIVVTGCLVPLRTGLFEGPGRDRTRFVPIREQAAIPGLLDGWSAPTAALPERPGPPGGPPAATAEVVLAQGCTSHCTYCYSRLARGRLASRSREAIVTEVDAAITRGATEVRLTSLDTSCWGVDRPDGPRLPDLLRALSDRPGVYRLRVGMMSPQSLEPIADDLFDAMARGPAFRFLHLPVQSGSDRVLAEMRRGYSVDLARRLVARARERLGELTLATDLIVGFPGETEEEFGASLALLDALEPEIVNVTRFSPRPLTPAALLPPLPSATLKRRSRTLTAHRTAVARRRLERWIGSTRPAWIVEPGSDGSTVARLENYLPVVLPEPYRGGGPATVRIEGARSSYLLGRRVPGPPPTPGSL